MKHLSSELPCYFNNASVMTIYYHQNSMSKHTPQSLYILPIPSITPIIQINYLNCHPVKTKANNPNTDIEDPGGVFLRYPGGVLHPCGVGTGCVLQIISRSIMGYTWHMVISFIFMFIYHIEVFYSTFLPFFSFWWDTTWFEKRYKNNPIKTKKDHI